jgi:hypothetical protein
MAGILEHRQTVDRPSDPSTGWSSAVRHSARPRPHAAQRFAPSSSRPPLPPCMPGPARHQRWVVYVALEGRTGEHHAGARLLSNSRDLDLAPPRSAAPARVVAAAGAELARALARSGVRRACPRSISRRRNDIAKKSRHWAEVGGGQRQGARGALPSVEWVPRWELDQHGHDTRRGGGTCEY